MNVYILQINHAQLRIKTTRDELKRMSCVYIKEKGRMQ